MNILKIDIENCYGIKKLKNDFDFSKKRVFAIYAQNGSMKTSLAKTFMDLSKAVDSKDCIFPKRVPVRKITDETDVALGKEQVFVIQPYDEVFGHTEKTSTLLVDSTLRKEYEQLHEDVNSSKETFLKSLKELSGSKKDLAKEISTAFTKSDDEFYKALLRVKDEVMIQMGAPFSIIQYDKIFDDKVVTFLNTKDFKTTIQEYTAKYNELLEASTYFKKGIFNYYNAAIIAKNLSDNGFFNAKHSITLNANVKTEITSQLELEKLIEDEKKGISDNETLKKKFAEIEKGLYKNQSLRDFNEYLLANMGLLPELANLERFKEEIWKSYFKDKIDLYIDLVNKYNDAKKRISEIEKEAGKQRTQWESVIKIFNRRFDVPFTLEAKNRIAVILGQEPLLSLSFIFKDGTDEASIDKTALLQVLSTGEKKALYILNIIFEIEARKQSKQETVFVVDDIADSFDYRNKYAIIEYLRDISEEPNFYQIILTHNFDFLRTIRAGDCVDYENCLTVLKTSSGLTLKKMMGIKNVFVNDWKKNFFTDLKKKIASIPFIRNIVEYTKGKSDPNYLKLTSLLHWRNDTDKITIGELHVYYKNVFGTSDSTPNDKEKVINVIKKEAEECLNAQEGINFENKIVLSIAIRLEAEKFMVTKINNTDPTVKIDGYTTRKLSKKFKEKCHCELENIEIIKRVLLMTPENIHLNAFMYEPIMDMSDEHLKQLYKDVCRICSALVI